MPITIHGDYERSSVDIVASGVIGDGNNAVIAIAPRLQASEVTGGEPRWLEPSARVTGVQGVRPLFRFTRLDQYHSAAAGVPWQASRRPMFSVDGVAWQYFDTCTVEATGVTFRHNTPFPADSIIVSRSRQMTVTQCAAWLSATVAANPGVFAATFTANAYRAQTDERGRAIPAQPLMRAQINDTSLMPVSGTKKVAMLVSGVHAGEDHGNVILQAIVAALLSDSPAARALRRDYRICVYPMVNAPGRAGGGWRGSFSHGVNGEDDANRHFGETGTGLDIVDVPKAAMTTDRAGQPVAWGIDVHGTYGSRWAAFEDSAVPASGKFRAALASAMGGPVVDEGDSLPGFVSEYLRGLGASPAITLEVGDPSPVSDAQISDFGFAVVAALAAMTAGAVQAPAPAPAPTPPPAPVSVVTRPTLLVSEADNPRHVKYDGSELDNLAAMTVLARVRPVAPAGGNGLLYLFGKRAANGQPRRLMVDYSGGSARLTFGSATTSALCPWGPVASSQRGSVVDGRSAMLGATYDGGLTAAGIRLIVNTPVSATETTAGGGSVSPDAGNPLTLLNRQELDREFSGDAEWLAVWNRVLSTTEVDAVRAGGPDAVPTGLVVLKRWAAVAPAPVPVLGAISGALSGGMFAATQNADGSWDVTISARVGP